MQNPKEWKSILQLVSLMQCCNVCSLKVVSVKVNFFIEHLESLRRFFNLLGLMWVASWKHEIQVFNHRFLLH